MSRHGCEIKDGKVTPGSGAEENLLCFPGDPYPTENIFLHEFAHTIHEPALAYIDKKFQRQVEIALRRGEEKRLMEDTYAATDHFEYWAEACNRGSTTTGRKIIAITASTRERNSRNTIPTSAN